MKSPPRVKVEDVEIVCLDPYAMGQLNRHHYGTVQATSSTGRYPSQGKPPKKKKTKK